MERLIVLDLNGVLLKHQGKGKASYRPGCHQFVCDLLKMPSIRVAIWTTITPDNAQKIIDGFLSKDIQSELLFIWTSKESTQSHDFKSIKNLDKIFGSYPQFNTHNTTILDDEEEKVPHHKDNLMLVPSYGGPRKSPQDEVLQQISNQIHLKFLYND